MNRSPIQRPDAVAAESARRVARARRSLRILSPALTALLLLPMAAQAASSDPPTTAPGTHASAARGDGSGSSTREHSKQADTKKADTKKKKKGNKKHRRVTSTFRTVAGDTRTVSATTSAATSVAPLPVLTITAVDVKSEYGALPVTYTVRVDGLKSGDDAATATQGLLISGPEPDANSGVYDIRLSGAKVPTGYGAIRYVNGQHVIYQAQLQVVVKSLTTTYGQAPTFDVRYYGLRNGDSVPARVLPPSVVPAGAVDGIQADSATDAGTYTIWPQVYDQNYEDHVTTGTWTVNKAPLVVGVDSAAMVWGDKVPAFRTTAIGLVNGETVAALTPIAVAGTTASRPSAGSYPVVPSGGVNANYATKYVSGTLTVAKRPVWVSVDDQTKVYGSPNPKFTVTVTGMPSGMTLPVSVQAPQPNLAPGKYALTPVPPSTGNIEFKELRAGTLTTVPAPLTITPADQAIPSGSLPGDLGWRSSGWVYDHTDARLTIKPTCGAVIGGTAVSAATRPGVYQDAIRCSGAVVPIGYTVTYATADLTVNPLVTLRATGLPTSIVPKATVDGTEVSLPRTGVEVAFGSEHSYSFPGVLSGSNGRLYITTAPAFSGPVSDNLAATASYSTMGQLISNAVTAGQVNAAQGRELVQTWSEAEFGLANDYLVRAGLEAFAAQVRSMPAQQLAPEAAKTLLDHARAVWTFAGMEGEM